MSNLFFEQNIIALVFSGLFIPAFIIQLFYYTRYFRKAIVIREKSGDENIPGKEPVSIIICAKNEAENLIKNLPLILEQDYPDFEVIVVNDRSEDETERILNELALKYPHLKSARVKIDPQFINGKKLALTLGIKASANEWLLLTDADCRPDGKQWLAQMQKNFRKNTDIVLGYGGYIKEPGLLNLLIRFETAYTAMQYIGMAMAGKPYMGVGRNLAYRKSLFFRNNGFGSHSGLISGDDDLFVNETATKNNIAVEVHPDSFTWSETVKNFDEWYRQKKRHLTTASRYNAPSKARLIIDNVSRMILLISFIMLLILSPFVYYILAAYLTLSLLKSAIFSNVCVQLNEKSLFLPSLFLEPIFPFFYSLIHISNYINRNQTKWK